LAVAVPMSLFLAGSSQAAPTLTIAQAQAQLTALQTKEDAADEAFDEGTLAAAQASASAKQSQAAVLAQSSKLTGMEQAIAAFAAASYTSGGLNPVDSLLAGGDPQTMLSRVANMNEVARSQDAQLIAISAQREVLAGAQQTATAKAAAATQALATLAAARTQITTVIAAEQAVLSHLQAQQRQALLAAQAAAQAASRAQARAALAKIVAPAAAGPSGSTAPVPNASGAAKIALQAAYSQMGKPYQYGAAGPNSYDCSGLVMWAYAQAGIALPHSAAAQYGYGTHVSESQFQPGDLVFYDEGYGIGHVGIYVGGGEMIDANHTGGWVGVRPLYNGLVGGTRL
jgi:cell wall-associated NlpC family hydrolase